MIYEPQFVQAMKLMDGGIIMFLNLDDPNKHISGERLGYTVMELTEFAIS